MSDPLRKELQSGFDFITGSSNNNISDSTDKSFTSAIVRELHVYGTVAKIGEQVNKKQSTTDNKKSSMMFRIGDNSYDNYSTIFNPIANDSGLVGNNQVKYQHKGLGKGLLAEAEKICREEYGLKKISVISAVGTRDYYRKFGYTNNGAYVTKLL
jgi:elongator complex protein 3